MAEKAPNFRRRITAARAWAARTNPHGVSQTETADLLAAARLVRNCWLEWGPTDDGTVQGESFEKALDELNRVVKKLS